MMAGDDGEKSCKNVKNGKFIRKKEHTEKTERLDKANMRVPIGTTYGSSWRMLKGRREEEKKNSWANIFVPFKITFSCLQHLFFVCFYESESIELYLFDVVLFYSMVVNGFILGCVFLLFCDKSHFAYRILHTNECMTTFNMYDVDLFKFFNDIFLLFYMWATSFSMLSKYHNRSFFSYHFKSPYIYQHLFVCTPFWEWSGSLKRNTFP